MAERQRRKNGSRGAMYIAVIVALMLLAVILGLSVFFKVSEIYVEGTGMYTAAEVTDVSGIKYDESIFFLNESAAAVKIKNALSYVDEVRIIRKLPGTITIEITESFPLAIVESSGAYWIIDENAKILERTEDASRLSGYIELRGIEPIMPAVGSTLSLGEDGAVRLGYLKETLAGIHRAGIQKDVSRLDLTNIANINFSYKGLYTVILGRGDEVQDKLWLLSKMLELYPEERRARFDVSEVTVGHYIPE